MSRFPQCVRTDIPKGCTIARACTLCQADGPTPLVRALPRKLACYGHVQVPRPHWVKFGGQTWRAALPDGCDMPPIGPESVARPWSFREPVMCPEQPESLRARACREAVWCSAKQNSAAHPRAGAARSSGAAASSPRRTPRAGCPEPHSSR